MFDIIVISIVWEKIGNDLKPSYLALLWDSFFEESEAQKELKRIRQRCIHAYILER